MPDLATHDRHGYFGQHLFGVGAAFLTWWSHNTNPLINLRLEFVHGVFWTAVISYIWFESSRRDKGVLPLYSPLSETSAPVGDDSMTTNSIAQPVSKLTANALTARNARAPHCLADSIRWAFPERGFTGRFLATNALLSKLRQQALSFLRISLDPLGPALLSLQTLGVGLLLGS